MPVVKSHTDILKQIKSKNFSPVYLLHGTEPFFIDYLVEQFDKHTLDESSKTFNQQILYGRDVSAGQVVDAASRYPMMSSHQLVLIKEAHELDDFGKLEAYIKKPVPSTVLVFAFRGKKVKANTKVYKAITHAGIVFESKPIYSNQVPNFIITQLRTKKRKAEVGVAELLAENLGTDLNVISGALDKLVINVPDSEQITAKHVELHVGISRQFNLFEYQDALGSKDYTRAVKIGYAFAKNEREHPLPLTLASLYGYFAGLYAIHDCLNGSEQMQKEATGIYSAFRLSKVRQAAKRWSKSQISAVLQTLATYDLKSKGVLFSVSKGSGGELTLEMTQRLVQIGAS